MLGDLLVGLWFPVIGGLGAFIVESYLLVTKPHLWDRKGNRYKAKIALGILAGFILAYVLQPSNLTEAFAIGVGWEAILSSIAKEATIISVTDGRVLRRLEEDDLPQLNDTLKDALEKMQKAGTKDRIPVVDKSGRLMGLMTDGMIKRLRGKVAQLPDVKLKDVMIGATEVLKVDEHDSVAKAISVMEKRQVVNETGQRVTVKGLTVIDIEGKVLGLLSLDDLKMLDKPLLGFGR